MEKSKIEGFIKRYNLNGCIESVKVVSGESDNQLETKFISEEKHVLGNVKLKGVNVGDCELGVYNTAQLQSQLRALGSEIEISPMQVGDRYVSVELKDKSKDFNFILSDLSVIPKAPNLKQLPDWDVVIKMDKDFVTNFTKVKSALPEANTFTLLMGKKSKKLEMVIGYSAIASNRATIAVTAEDNKNSIPKAVSFSAKYFNEILKSNADSTEAVLNVSSKGLATIKFSTDDYEAEYYLTEIPQED